jgi:hypothetical protein
MTIILMSDLREIQVNKQKELEYYHGQLRELLVRMSIVQAEVNLTTKIIDMVEHEQPEAPIWAKL